VNVFAETLGRVNKMGKSKGMGGGGTGGCSLPVTWEICRESGNELCLI
jgi:hypothetical protein